uniref:RNA-binding region RNP-1 (RNA recognition motif) n=1 Tax=Medicago truncatula TaxID=3880 RepID=A2Q266_MEDTR|nr:RNA-binding region RNP-1 (RNA recognition motif) [Medicago truncatula]
MSQRIGTKLFVSRLSFYTTQQQLESLFSPFGVLTEATLITDQNTQRPKGFGFVSYKSEIEAEKARKALNGRVILTFSYLYIMP